MNLITRLGSTALLLASSVLMAAPPTLAVTLVPPNSDVEGKSIAEWTTEWWKSAVQQTNDIFTDPMAWVNQSGPVYFLTSVGGSGQNPDNTNLVEREYQVPGDKFLLIPILNVELGARELGFSEAEFDAPQTAESVKNATIEIADEFTNLFASINGVPITDIDQRRYDAPFEYNAVEDNIFGLPTGVSGPAYVDGYWLMFEPVGTKTFDLKLEGVASDFNFVINTKDKVTGTTVPEPSVTLALLALTGSGLFLTRKHKAKLEGTFRR